MTRRWPGAAAYAEAVQDPDSAFVDPKLADVVVREGMFGLPAAMTGQHAVVFPATLGARDVALRCFTSAPDDVADRYRAVAEFRAAHSEVGLAGTEWIDVGISVAGQEWPVLVMDWVAGRPLHRWVADHRGDAVALTGLADALAGLTATCHAAGMAHGDLQHGNVLVDDDGTPRLVDYDGMWLAALDGRPPDEVGHPAYQHPQRLAEGGWGPHMDWFAALVIDTSVRAVAADPAIWELHDDERLVLSHQDLGAPGDTPAWERLAASPDDEVVRRVGVLVDALGRRADLALTLDDVVALGVPATAATWQPADTGPRDLEPVRADWSAISTEQGRTTGVGVSDAASPGTNPQPASPGGPPGPRSSSAAERRPATSGPESSPAPSGPPDLDFAPLGSSTGPSVPPTAPAPSRRRGQPSPSRVGELLSLALVVAAIVLAVVVPEARDLRVVAVVGLGLVGFVAARTAGGAP